MRFPLRGTGYRFNTIFILIIAITSFSVYFNTLFNGFVLDDISVILGNYWIKDIKYIPDIFATNVWGFSGRDANYYRPLMHLVYMLNYKIFGLDAWGFHLVNVLFHTLVCILVYLVALRLFRDQGKRDAPPSPWPSFAAALLFAVHPIHTEAVAWVAVPEVYYSFFFLLAFYLYIRIPENDGIYPLRWGYLLSLISYFIATLAKEPAITLPILLVSYDLLLNKPGMSRRMQFMKRHLPYLLVAGIYFILRIWALGGLAPRREDLGLNLTNNIVNASPLFLKYLEKLVLPIHLNAFHVYRPVTSILDFNSVVALCFMGVFIAIAIVMWKKHKFAFFSLLFLVVPLSPAFYISGLTQGGKFAFAERYLYLPSFGYFLILAIGIDWWIRVKPITVKPLTAACLGLLILYFIGTFLRNPVWKDNYTIWADAADKEPDNEIAHQNLGYALIYYKHRPDEAKKHFQIASRLKPDIADTIIQNGIDLTRRGMIDKAILEFNVALLYAPESVEARYNLGIVYEKKGWKEQAIEQYKLAVGIKPDFTAARNNLGILYAESGRIENAIEQFSSALKVNPNDNDIRQNLTRAYKLKGLTNPVEKELSRKGIAR